MAQEYSSEINLHWEKILAVKGFVLSETAGFRSGSELKKCCLLLGELDHLA